MDKPKEPITNLVWISQKSPIQTDVYKPKEPNTNWCGYAKTAQYKLTCISHKSPIQTDVY